MLINVKSTISSSIAFFKKTGNIVSAKNSLLSNNQRITEIREITVHLDSAESINQILTRLVDLCCDISGVGFSLLARTSDCTDSVRILGHSTIKTPKMHTLIAKHNITVTEKTETDPINQLKVIFSKINKAVLNPDSQEILVFEHLGRMLKGIWPASTCDAIQKRLGCKKVVVLPLAIEDCYWGSLILLLTHDISIDTLEFFKSQVTIALKNRYALEMLSMRNQELSAVNSVAKKILQSQDIKHIVGSTVSEVKGIFKANGVGLYMKDKDTGGLKLSGQCGMPDEIIKRSTSYGPNEPYCQILKSEQPIIFGSMKEFPVHYENIDRAAITQLPVWFMMAIIIIDGNREGTLTVVRFGEEEFSSNERELLVSICNQLSIAFENANLHQKLLGRISELENARNRLSESEQKMHLTVESVSEAIMVASLDGKIIRANKAASSMHGHERNDEFVGKSALMYVSWEDRRRMLENLKNIKETGVFRNAEYALLKQDGRPFQAECSISVFRSFLGIPEGFVICIRDISARKQAQKRLLDNERKYRLIADNTNDYIALMSFGGNYTYVSPSFRQLGYEPTEMINKQGLDIIHPDDKKILLPALIKFAQMDKKDFARMRKENFSRHMEYRVKDKQGNWHDFDSSGNIVESYDGNGYNLLLISRDVTERKKDANLLKKLYDSEKEARQALEQEINRRADFFRALVHELKTPLTPIMVSSETLRDLAPDKTFSNLASNVYNSAIRLNNRVDELLDISKGELGLLKLNLDPVDIGRVLRTYVGQIRPQLEQNLQTLVTNIPDYVPQIMGEEIRIRQIILNLFDNAIKFTPENGQIILSVIADEKDVLIKLRDTGKGIEDVDQERLFQPYNRIESDRQHYSGLGLGLALCKQLVDLHHGKLWIESQKGQGTTFYLSFPVMNTSVETPTLSKSIKLVDAVPANYPQ